MLTFQVEPLGDILGLIPGLLQEHYQELTLNKQRISLNPDWPRYTAMADAGEFIALTVRADEEIVGYAGFILQSHLHYRDLLVAQNDVLFLKEQYRLGTTGWRFIKYCHSTLVPMADKITWHVKAKKDFRPLLHRLGYADEDVIAGLLTAP